MKFKFTINDIKNITATLGVDHKDMGDAWSWKLANEETGQQLVVTITNDVNLGKDRQGALISVQTHHGYYELHDCLGYLVFEPDEVIFLSAKDELISCMIIGKQCTCSMYSNISRDILSADFGSLDPAVLLSAMQLSLTEDKLPEILDK